MTQPGSSTDLGAAARVRPKLVRTDIDRKPQNSRFTRKRGLPHRPEFGQISGRVVYVPDNLDTIIDELKRIGRWNAAAASAASLAALCATYVFSRGNNFGFAGLF